jgi:hypothetical protein
MLLETKKMEINELNKLEQEETIDLEKWSEGIKDHLKGIE